LTFSKTERRGIIVLVVIIFCLIALNQLMPRLIKKSTTDFSVFQQEVELLLATQDQLDLEIEPGK